MPFLSEFMSHLPFLVTVSPLFGSALVWWFARQGSVIARQTAVMNSTLTLGLALAMLVNVLPKESQPPGHSAAMSTHIVWGQAPFSAAASPAVRWSLDFRVDGLSLLPLVVIAFIGWVTVVTADRCGNGWTGGSDAVLLLGQALAMAMFAAQDFLLFLALCEAWSWWTFFAIGRHGGPNRRETAHRMLLMSTFARLAWGLAGWGCAVCHAWIQAEVQGGVNGVSFLYPEMFSRLARWVAGHEMAFYAWTAFQPWVLLLWMAGLWAAWPLFPLHSWWRALFAEGRPPMVALFAAASMLQVGTVLFRFVVPLFPTQGAGWTTLLAATATLGTGYFGFLAISQLDWRRLLSALSLFSLHTVLIGGLSGGSEGSLLAWQTLNITALVVAAGMLLIGHAEQSGLTLEFVGAGGQAFLTPRWFTLMALSGGLLTAGPMWSLISGQVVAEYLELRRLGVPNLSLWLGGLLSGVSLCRACLQKGFGSKVTAAENRGRTIVVTAEKSSDLQGRSLLIGVLVGLAFSLGVAPNDWQSWVRPVFEQLHNPFVESVSTPVSDESQKSGGGKFAVGIENLDSRVSPVPSSVVDNRFRIAAPLIWMVFGFGLLIASRLVRQISWSSTWGTVGLLMGLAVEISRSPGGSSSVWMSAVIWSLGLSGLVMITVVGSPREIVSPAQCAGWLIRLSAVGAVAFTTDLLLFGLAWEMVELARWLSMPGSQPSPQGDTRERFRHQLSSAVFWLGVAMCLSVTGTTEFDQIVRQLERHIPRDDDGMLLGLGPQRGLAAVLLIVSGIGMRCGLTPFSLGRQHDVSEGREAEFLLDAWWGQLLGLTMLFQTVQVFHGAYAEPMTVMYAIAALATAIWAALGTVGESRVHPLVQKLLAFQFSGLVLLLAARSVDLKLPHSPLGQLNSRVLLEQIPAGGSITLTLSLCGLIAVLRRLRGPSPGDLFLEHFRGLFSKCSFESVLLLGALYGLIGAWPTGGFWTRWLGCLGVMLTPQQVSEESIRPHALLLGASIVWQGCSLLPLSAAARWLRRIALDPAVSSWTGSQRRWDLVVATAAVLLSLIFGLFSSL